MVSAIIFKKKPLKRGQLRKIFHLTVNTNSSKRGSFSTKFYGNYPTFMEGRFYSTISYIELFIHVRALKLIQVYLHDDRVTGTILRRKAFQNTTSYNKLIRLV